MKSKIAILGIRGIPANYGGFETFVEELSTRLAARGHDVTVYCRKGSSDWTHPTYKGVKLVHFHTLKHKYLDTIAHTLLATLHVTFSGADIVYYCNAINSIYTFLPRLFGKKVWMNVNGLEWKRAKWSGAGKIAYQVSEWIATVFANEIISDSRRIQFYYKKKFNRDSILLSYGANPGMFEDDSVLEKYGLKKGNYFLIITRLEPENNAHLFIKAFEQVKTDRQLAIVGDAPYARPYIQGLRATKDPRVRFLGTIYDLHEKSVIQSQAFAYLHGNEVGGTNPALLEAMGKGRCVIANGVKFNREVLGDAGLWFKNKNILDLKEKIETILTHPEQTFEMGERAIRRIVEHYNWEDVTTQYESYLEGKTCTKEEAKTKRLEREMPGLLSPAKEDGVAVGKG